MKKKISALLIAFVMVFTATAFTTTPAEAATIPFMTVSDTYSPKEKTGDYYVWVDIKINYDTGAEKWQLRASKDANKKGVLIKELSGSQQFGNKIVTDGQTIYYSVHNFKKNTSTIYKTNVKGKAPQIIKTEKKCDSVEPVTVFNGKLYYDRQVADAKGNISWNIYSVNLSSKKCVVEKKGFAAQSGYGRYITCDNEFKDVKTQLFNVKTKTSTKLIKSRQSRVFSDRIYYSGRADGAAFVKKTDLKGKNLKTIKTKKGAAWNVEFLGKKFAVFENYNTDQKQKLVYSTGKLVNVPEDF